MQGETLKFNIPVCLHVSTKRKAGMCKQSIVNYNRRCAYANGIACLGL